MLQMQSRFFLTKKTFPPDTKLDEVEERLSIVLSQELRRAIKAERRSYAKAVRTHSGIYTSQSKIRTKFTSQWVKKTKDLKHVKGRMTFRTDGISLIHFTVNRNKPTSVPGVPVLKRKPPVIRVYKGRKTKLKHKTFIGRARVKKVSGDDISTKKNYLHVFTKQRRTRKKFDFRLLHSISLLSIVRKGGLTLDDMAKNVIKRVMKKMFQRRKYILSAGSK